MTHLSPFIFFLISKLIWYRFPTISSILLIPSCASFLIHVSPQSFEAFMKHIFLHVSLLIFMNILTRQQVKCSEESECSVYFDSSPVGKHSRHLWHWDWWLTMEASSTGRFLFIHWILIWGLSLTVRLTDIISLSTFYEFFISFGLMTCSMQVETANWLGNRKFKSDILTSPF